MNDGSPDQGNRGSKVCIEMGRDPWMTDKGSFVCTRTMPGSVSKSSGGYGRR